MTPDRKQLVDELECDARFMRAHASDVGDSMYGRRLVGIASHCEEAATLLLAEQKKTELALAIADQLAEEDSERHQNCPICFEDNTRHSKLCLLAHYAETAKGEA